MIARARDAARPSRFARRQRSLLVITSKTTFWKAYQAAIPSQQHQPGGKETGETAHIERFNNTLRQRLARFVRKTLSFSKSLLMHEICLSWFVWRYNMDIRQKYLQAVDM
jgi:insertion element IS1 protein InsB